MAFGKRTKGPVTPLTNAELIALHQQSAENLLKRAGKGGRLEAETRLATMATAHATLAVSYRLAPPDPEDFPTLEDDSES
jgi:hypothetical protein